MGEVFDEDEDRLMIDDATIDPSASHTSRGNNDTTTSPRLEKFAKLQPLGNGQDGIENHPLDPDTKPSLFCDSGNSKVLPAGSFNVESIKEEGEIDDEEDPFGGSHGFSSSATSGLENTNNWSLSQQNAGFDVVINGGPKYSYGEGQEQNAAVDSTVHILLGPHHLSSQPASKENPNVAELVGKPQSVGHTAARLKTISCVQETKKEGEDCDTESPQSVAHGVTNSPTSGENVTTTSFNNKIRRKKRRNSEEREDRQETQPQISTRSIASSASSSSTGAATLIEVSPKRKKPSTRDKSTCVSAKSVQTNDDDIDVKVGSNYCLDFSVLAKVSGCLYFVSNWNGRELYGILGDGLPPMMQTYMSRKHGASSNAAGENGFETSNSGVSHERNNGTPAKQRTNHKRSNRSSSVCPANGFPEKPTGKKNLASTVGRPASASTSELQSVGSEALHDDEMSQSPVSWLSSGGSDPLYGIGSSAVGTCSGLMQLKETDPSTMMSCSVAGCCYRCDTDAALTFHMQSHFDKRTGRAIIVENVATQTSSSSKPVGCVDVSTETDRTSVDHATDVVTVSTQTANEEPAPHTPGASCGDLRGDRASSSRNITSTLSTTEQQSISELFQVVVGQNDQSGTTSSSPLKKNLFQDAKSLTKTPTKLNVGSSQHATTALDAIEKMVSGSAQSSNAESPSISAFPSSMQHHQQTGVISSAAVTLPSANAPIVGGTTHMAAASPAFSDISDDAPTLEKEVSDKADDRCLERVKVNVTSTAQNLGPLSLSVNSEKGCTTAAAGSGDVSGGALLCATVPVTSTLSNTSASRTTVDTAPSTSGVPTTSEAGKKETKPLLSSSAAPLNTFPSYVGLDTAAFSSGIRPSLSLLGNPPNLQGTNANASMVYGSQQYMIPMNAFSVPNTAQPNVGTTPGSSKHKIHDLKAAAPGLPNSHKDSSPLVRMSPSMIASPGSRPLSGGPPSGCSLTSGSSGGISGIGVKSSSQQQLSGGSNAAASQRPSSGKGPFMVTQNPPVGQTSSDRNSAAAQAISLMQQQQQQAHYQALIQQQQQQQMQYMSSQLRFPTGFPVVAPPTSAAATAAAYEQLAAMQASFGLFVPPAYPPK